MILIDKEKLLKNLSGMFNIKTIEKIKKVIDRTPSIEIDGFDGVAFSIDEKVHLVKTNE